MKRPHIFVMLGILSLLGAVGGCSDVTNRPPRLLPINDAEFGVNTRSTLDLFAEDPDGDSLEYSFTIEPEPPTRTQTVGGRPQLDRLNNERALFSWTPGIADAGGQRSKDYSVTFTVTDGRGGRASETILLRVVNDGVAGSGTLRFVEPTGSAISVDLRQRECVDALLVEVKGDLIPNEDVEFALGEPAPQRATLSPSGPGKRKTFSWCPTPEQLDASLIHAINFVARPRGTDDPIIKRFQVRFRRPAAAGCAGSPPVIEHQPPGSVGGPLNYEITALITDDTGFKTPPLLAFIVSPESDPTVGGEPDTSDWQAVEFVSIGDDRWRAAIPNALLAEGESVDIYYVIIATDNDGDRTSGTRCNHTTESEVFKLVVTGDASGGGGATYGYCERCVADAQCGGDDDLCVSLRGESFCGRSCGVDGAGRCGEGEQCLIMESVGGVSGGQCVPVDLNCGQLCVVDSFDSVARNETVEDATLITPGTYEQLSVCGDDIDIYRFVVGEGQSVRARIEFDNRQGDLDLAMMLPGDEDFDYLSLNADVDFEQVSEPCTGQGGEGYVAVFPYAGANNRYRLILDVGPGECDRSCEGDGYDRGRGNSIADEFAPIDLPFYEEGLQLCAGDSDFFGFDAAAGEIIFAGILFDHARGDLDLRLYRSSGALIAESRSARDTELVEIEAPATDIYLVEVFGATRSAQNEYGLLVELNAAQGCQDSRVCPANTYCVDGACAEDRCERLGGCGDGHQCVPPRAGLDPARSSGRCVAACRSDQDCRRELGYACKRFEDFTLSCAPAGVARVGERCAGYQDCAGEQICLGAPGGYCAAGGCAADLPCPAGTVCGSIAGVDACLKACTNNGECRSGEGYTCRDVGGGRRGCAL